MEFIVYKITNRINHKCYVGFTRRTLEQRWKSHISASIGKSKFRFHSAIRKYGVDNWNKEILEKTHNIEFAKILEKKHIQLYNSCDRRCGYNATDGGTGGWVVPDSKIDSWKEKLSLANSGKGNGNSINISNDAIIELSVSFVHQYGFIPGRVRLQNFALSKNMKIPKTFTSYRFDGKYSNLVSIVENIVGIKYNAYHKDDEQRKLAAKTILATNKKRWNKE
jgi:group I intron endonuclease